MRTLSELWTAIDEQNVALHNALDVLYTMSEAAKSKDIDHSAFANALMFLYDCLSQIEVQYALLNEELVKVTK